MKKLVLLFTLGLVGCNTPHLAETVGMDSSALAKLAVTNNSARLVKVDGNPVEAPVIGSYYVKPGARELEFQIQHAGATAPGKSIGHSPTTVSRFVSTKAELKPGLEYRLIVTGSRTRPELAIKELGPSSANQLARVD